MLSTYCQHCGSKNEYSSVKPKFCSSCGQMLAGDFNEARAAVPAQQDSNPVSSQSISIDDPDGTDVYRVPNLRKLEYDIEVSSSSFTLGSVLPRYEEDAPPKKKRGRPKKNV
jgi:hypothetical protein